MKGFGVNSSNSELSSPYSLVYYAPEKLTVCVTFIQDTLLIMRSVQMLHSSGTDNGMRTIRLRIHIVINTGSLMMIYLLLFLRFVFSCTWIQ